MSREKAANVLLFGQPVRADILLVKRWETFTIPEFSGNGVEFYDRWLVHLGVQQKKTEEPKRREGEPELETAPTNTSSNTTNTTNPTKEEILQKKIDKLEAVFQFLLRQASELSALFRHVTIEGGQS